MAEVQISGRVESMAKAFLASGGTELPIEDGELASPDNFGWQMLELWEQYGFWLRADQQIAKDYRRSMIEFRIARMLGEA